jgi:sulfate permease, SulP family
MPTRRSSLGARQEQQPQLIPGLTSGLVLGVIEVVLVTSFAALIFAGDAAVHIPSAISLLLAGAVVIMVTVGLMTSLPPTVASVQDSTAAILALIAASITSELPRGTDEAFLTIVATITLSSVLAGVAFFVLGRFGLGNLVRFIPYPVVGGFLAGTGWLLFKGGAGVLTGTSLTMASLDTFGRGDVAAKWLPGLLFALIVLLLVRWFRHFLIIPASVVTALAIFYGVLWIGGIELGDAEAHGWFLGPFPAGAGRWEPWSLHAFTGADWAHIFAQTANIVTLLVVALLALLLNATGIEQVLNRDGDVNRELRAAGAANLIAGLGGGIIGFHALSFTALARRTGATGRVASLVGAAVCVVALVAGTDPLALFPRSILGGLLVFLGLAFLVEWLYDAWFKLPRRDYLVILLIVVSVAAFGFLPGVAIGLIAAVVLFVIDYSRTDVVKHALSGATYQSRVDRDPQGRDVLRQRGDAIHILELQGFVFFGTGNSLLERIRDRIDDAGSPSLRFLVLDLRRVTGIDSSAVVTFSKVLALAESVGFTVVLTALPDSAARQLRHADIDETPDGSVRLFPDLDRGVQWCEEQILDLAPAEASDAGQPLPALLRDGLGASVDSGKLMTYLEPVEVPAAHELIRQGDVCDELFFLESGLVTAQFSRPDGQSVRLRTMGPGTVVGEVTMYLGTVRTASVVTDAPSRLYRLTRKALEEMQHRDPRLAAALHKLFARLLADRLSDALRTMDALMD